MANFNSSPFSNPLRKQQRGRQARSQGNKAEQLAVALIEKNGFTCLAQNYRSKAGEIDIIATQGELLLFIEVKHRSNRSYGSAEEMVNPAKQKKIVRAAKQFLQQQPRYQNHQCRFDVIAFNGQQQASWLTNAFEAY